MREPPRRTLLAALRRYDDATVKRYTAGVEAIKAGRGSPNDIRSLAEEYERPIWQAVLDALDAYLALPGQTFPPEIALCMAGALRELLTSGMPPTWVTLRHQGGPDSPTMMDCKRAAVEFLLALDDPEVGPAMRAFDEAASLAGTFGVTTDDIGRWLDEARQPRAWDDGSAIPFQHINLFRVLGFSADVAGVAAAYGGKTTNTIRAWRRDERLSPTTASRLDLSEFDPPARARIVWARYANGAAGYQSLSYMKRRRGRARVKGTPSL